MTRSVHVARDDTRSRCTSAMSEMYRQEVPKYGTLLELVAEINARRLADRPQLRDALLVGRRPSVIRGGCLTCLYIFPDFAITVSDGPQQ